MRINKKSMIYKVLALTIPNVATNITVPLLGMVDLAIVGHLGGTAYLGAIALGTAIFNLVYWNFGFLRMGTTGLTAQAFGARNLPECGVTLHRSMAIALSAALAIVVLQHPIFMACDYFMNVSPTIEPIVKEYFNVRVWAAPATLSLYAIKGWFIGMQNARTPMMIAIVLNCVNIAVSYSLAVGMDMGIAGVAWGTLIAQYSGMIMAIIIIARHYKKAFRGVSLVRSLKIREMGHFFNVNRDIFLRTMSLVVVFTFFTSASSKISDEVLAINTLLMQLFTLFSYIEDGFAYSAESLAGRYYGAGNGTLLRQSIRVINRCGIISAVAFTLIYVVVTLPILKIFTNDTAILEQAMQYRWWVAAIPICGYLAFIYDGIAGGMTKTAIMRNTIIIATAAFFAAYYSLINNLGNNALWIALLLFLILRGVLQLGAINKIVKRIK